MTILSGDYPPVKVVSLDLVGYTGDGVFVIISPIKWPDRRLPKPGSDWEGMPWCIRARVENNQAVNFNGKVATLHDINGTWHFRMHQTGELKNLQPYTFFEIGEGG